MRSETNGVLGVKTLKMVDSESQTISGLLRILDDVKRATTNQGLR